VKEQVFSGPLVPLLKRNLVVYVKAYSKRSRSHGERDTRSNQHVSSFKTQYYLLEALAVPYLHTMSISITSHAVCIWIFALLVPLSVQAQSNHLVEQRDTQTTQFPFSVWSIQDTTQQRDRKDVETKSPALAMTLSALLPGAGQFYTERYWKIPIIYGFGAWFAVNWKKADDLYRQYRDEYSASVASREFLGKGDEQLRFIRDFYRNERDRFSLYLGLTYLLNIVDAYVGASLYSFDVGEDLTGGANLRLNVRLPLR